LLTLEDVFHNIDSRLNLFKEREDDTNKVKYEFNLKMSIDQFCEIMHISQTVHQNELKFFKEILDTWNYILVNVHVKLSSRTYNFRGSKLLDKSC
jgi:hypothetical protein